MVTTTPEKGWCGGGSGSGGGCRLCVVETRGLCCAFVFSGEPSMAAAWPCPLGVCV